MVEMVFAVPMLLIFAVGVIEIGRAIHMHQALTDGTRAAVRYLTRVPDPCIAQEQSRAFGLLVTRSTDWSEAPQFPDWPANEAEMQADTDFVPTITGCVGGALAGEQLTLHVRYRLGDTFGVLHIIGMEDGVFMEAIHQERHMGV